MLVGGYGVGVHVKVKLEDVCTCTHILHALRIIAMTYILCMVGWYLGREREECSIGNDDARKCVHAIHTTPAIASYGTKSPLHTNQFGVITFRGCIALRQAQHFRGNVVVRAHLSRDGRHSEERYGVGSKFVHAAMSRQSLSAHLVTTLPRFISVVCARSSGRCGMSRHIARGILHNR